MQGRRTQGSERILCRSSARASGAGWHQPHLHHARISDDGGARLCQRRLQLRDELGRYDRRTCMGQHAVKSQLRHCAGQLLPACQPRASTNLPAVIWLRPAAAGLPSCHPRSRLRLAPLMSAGSAASPQRWCCCCAAQPPAWQSAGMHAMTRRQSPSGPCCAGSRSWG